MASERASVCQRLYLACPPATLSEVEFDFSLLVFALLSDHLQELNSKKRQARRRAQRLITAGRLETHRLEVYLEGLLDENRREKLEADGEVPLPQTLSQEIITCDAEQPCSAQWQGGSNDLSAHSTVEGGLANAAPPV